MKYFRFSYRVIGFLLLLGSGLLIAFAVYPWLGKSAKDVVLTGWSRLLMKTTGVQIRAYGEPLAGSVMLVANHVSWIDIFILNSCRATSFIAKLEIRSWPVVGWLVAAVGTIFILRGSRQAVIEINQKMKSLFDEQTCIGLFPEGTTSDGSTILPLYSGLLEGAMQAQVPIQPAMLVFKYQGRRSGYASFIGEQTLVKNIWILLSSSGIAVDVHFLESITERGQSVSETRQELADKIRTVLLQKLQTES